MTETLTNPPPSEVLENYGVQESDFPELDHHKAWKKQESQESFMEDYLRRTESLIQTIQGGVETANDKEVAPFDTVFFIDKSARPLYWMMKEMWPLIAKPDENGDIPPKPDVRFINVDRLPWRINPEKEISKDATNMRNATTQEIEGLKAIYDHPEGALRGKRALIVDEVNDSGDTAHVTRDLLNQAFPNTKFQSFSWMDISRTEESKDKHGDIEKVKIVEEVPVWYSPDNATGRGVSDQAGTGNNHVANSSARLTEASHQFLSTRPNIVRTKYSEEEMQRINELNQAIDAESDTDKRKALEDEQKEITTSTVDQKGFRLRQEMGRMVQAVIDFELLPAFDHQNMMPQAEYDKLLTEKMNIRNAALARISMFD